MPPEDKSVAAILAKLNEKHSDDSYNPVEWLKAVGLTIKDLAEEIHCTPQHLGAVLNGRARMTEKMEEKIRKGTAKLVCNSTFRITLNISGGRWLDIKDMMPENIDFNETIINALEWIGNYFFMAACNDAERERIIRNTMEEEESPVHPLKEPLLVCLKDKKKKVYLPIDIELKGPFHH